MLALWQTNIRRLLAYSSIAHGGYILIGVAVGLAHAERYDGGEASTGLAASTARRRRGAFLSGGVLPGDDRGLCGAEISRRPRRQVDGVDELAGLGRTRPLPAMALAVSMFSLAGVPPLAGFWGKLTLFTGAGRRCSVRRRRLAAAVVRRVGDYRRHQRGDRNGLLSARRGSDVFPHEHDIAATRQGRRGRRRLVGDGRLYADGARRRRLSRPDHSVDRSCGPFTSPSPADRRRRNRSGVAQSSFDAAVSEVAGTIGTSSIPSKNRRLQAAPPGAAVDGG